MPASGLTIPHGIINTPLDLGLLTRSSGRAAKPFVPERSLGIDIWYFEESFDVALIFLTHHLSLMIREKRSLRQFLKPARMTRRSRPPVRA